MTEVRIGDPVELCVDAARADGATVAFDVVTPDGSVIAKLDGTVESGVARVAWIADAGGAALPAEVTFLARLGDRTVESPPITIVGSGRLGALQCVLLGEDRPGGGTTLEAWDGDEAAIAAQPPSARGGGRELRNGDELGLLVLVGAEDGGPAAGDGEIELALEHEAAPGETEGGRAMGAPPPSYVLSTIVRPVKAGDTRVGARWHVDTTALEPPYRFRVRARWTRRDGEDAAATAALPVLIARLS